MSFIATTKKLFLLWISFCISTLNFFYTFKYLSLLMILCFLINQIIIIHPTPSLSYFISLPSQWYIRHTLRKACYSFLCLSEYGNSTSEKHPLLHFLTKPSQCHQPQDHEGHQQIPANPTPPLPNNLKIILLCISVCFLPIFGAHFTRFWLFP